MGNELKTERAAQTMPSTQATLSTRSTRMAQTLQAARSIEQTSMDLRLWGLVGVMAVSGSLAACGGGDEDASEPEAQAILSVKAYVTSELEKLVNASSDLEVLAPTPDADGWTMASDADAVLDMRAAWRNIRAPYERIEGAIAVLFPDLDASTDERYDGFIEFETDDNLFDDQGVTGVHAVERILWADAHPEHVVQFESALPNYREARFPSNEAEASDFKAKLAHRLAIDTTTMRDTFRPLALDSSAAFRGVIGSVEEQFEKVSLAASGEDESRYAQFTLGDMRNNLEGGHEIFSAFKPWLLTTAGGEALADEIQRGFSELRSVYDALPGDALPDVPATWNPDAPSSEDLLTPYGALWQRLSTESDPDQPASLVSKMLAAATALGLPQI